MLAVLCLFGALTKSSAQGPDSNYVRIYQIIQEADGLRERGQSKAALTRYREARQELLDFQKEHPTWHQNIINYRLNYVDMHLKPLAEKLEPKGVEPVAEPDLTKMTPEQQLPALQQQIQELENQNTLLQDRLKEALAARPAEADPHALAQALERAKELEKERDLLRVTLETRTTAPPQLADPATLQEEQGILQRVQAELAATQRQNLVLQQEIKDLRARGAQPMSDSDLARQLTAATTTVEELRTANLDLRTQVAMLEARIIQMNEMSADDRARQQIKSLESELKTSESDLKSTRKDRDSLAKKLAAADRRLEKRDTEGEMLELESQLTLAQARLDVLEAEAVPLTAEEAALVDGGSRMSVSLKDTNQVNDASSRANRIPPGAGPLIADAQRAVDQRQFALAEEKLKEVLQQDENNVYTLAHLAGVMLELDKTEEAEVHLKKALSIDPNDPGSLYLTGYLNYQRERYDDALDALSQSARLDPEKPETQYFLGLTLFKNGDRGPAETALRKAIQLRPAWGSAHYQLAVVYATQKPPFKELAQWHYQKALDGGSPRNFELEKLLEPDAAAGNL